MKTSVYIALSANGFISNSRNVPDWLSEEYGNGFYEICQKTKAVIMGKTTYNILAPDYLPLIDEGATVVLSSDTESASSNRTVVFTNKAPGEIVAMLEQKGHTEAVIVGGSLTISEFMKANLVDEVVLIVEPVFFGKGLPLLTDVEFESKLHLVDIVKLNADTVRLHYTVQKQA